MSHLSSKVFGTLIIILGALNIFIGLNVALGGILTMGWMGQTKFFEVIDEHAYLVQDSHMRFFGGLYVAMGIFLIIAASNLRRYHTALSLAFILIFAGGVARLTMGRMDILFGKDIITSFLAEIILMPVLLFWLSRLMKSK